VFGLARDATGTPIRGVAITLVSLDSDAGEAAWTDAGGRYRFPGVSPGRYRFEAAMPGFKRFLLREMTVVVNQQAQLDITLEIGELAETVEVVARASLDTAASSIDRFVDNVRIQSLPLDTRNIYTLIYLTPGVAGTIGNTHNKVSYSVNGAARPFPL
jgi:hypothetical protein